MAAPDGMVRYSDLEVSALADPAAREWLKVRGLPREHLLFGALEHIEPLVSASGATRLRLGEVGEHDDLVVDTATGEVIDISADDGREWHVNDSVGQFAVALATFTAANPFYPFGADLDVREAAADRLRTEILRTDPTALREDPGFWNSILFDVAAGDYSDED